MESAGLEKPIFQTEGFFFKVIFKRDLSLHAKNNDVNGIKDGVKEIQEKMIKLIRNDCKITIPQIASKLDISPRKVQRLLKSLTDNGIIIRKDGRKNGYWQVENKD